MQSKKVIILSKGNEAPVKLLRGHTQPSDLPIPSEIRERERVEKWRHKLWQSRHKYFDLENLAHIVGLALEFVGQEPGAVPA